MICDIILLYWKRCRYSAEPLKEVTQMPVSEKKKASNAKWNSKNLSTLGCSVRKEQAAAFKAHCEAQGKTSNTVLKD